VLEAVWEIIKLHGRAGSIRADAVTSDGVTEWLRLDREPTPGGDRTWEDWVAIGLERCFKEGAIFEHGGRVHAKDWLQYQVDATHAARQERYRQRRRRDGGDASPGVTDECDDDRTGRDETEHAPRARLDQLEWKVQETFSRVYAGSRYGNPPKWIPGEYGKKSRTVVLPYLRDVLKLQDVTMLQDRQVERAIAAATENYLKDMDEFNIKNRHGFGLFASHIDRYVPTPGTTVKEWTDDD
jgi:hypothetical protein